MHTFLTFVGLAIFVVCVIALAAGVTATVVRISPTRDRTARRSSSG